MTSLIGECKEEHYDANKVLATRLSNWTKEYLKYQMLPKGIQ